MPQAPKRTRREGSGLRKRCGWKAEVGAKEGGAAISCALWGVILILLECLILLEAIWHGLGVYLLEEGGLSLYCGTVSSSASTHTSHSTWAWGTGPCKRVERVWEEKKGGGGSPYPQRPRAWFGPTWEQRLRFWSLEEVRTQGRKLQLGDAHAC